MSERIGMGHVYSEATGTGIEWASGKAWLWHGGKVMAEAAHATATPWEFWHGLHFRTVFPMITHWGFRSVWTGRVKVSSPETQPLDDEAVWGWMTFDLLDEPRRPWAITDTNPVGIEPPLPPNEEQLANLPLRLMLARTILSVFRDELPPDSWVGVTSLVAARDLNRAFPLTHKAATEVYGGEWRLAMGDSLMAAPLRDALCTVLGLKQPVTA